MRSKECLDQISENKQGLEAYHFVRRKRGRDLNLWSVDPSNFNRFFMVETGWMLVRD